MATTKLLHLSPLFFNPRSSLGGAERYPLNLARGLVAASQGRWEVEVVSFDRSPRCQVIEPGVTYRFLPAVNHEKSALTVLSWELPAALAAADLVHIHQVAMRASEMALLLAKQQGKPVCVTDHGSTASSEGIYPDRLELADQVICYSDYGATLLQTQTPKEVIKGGVDSDFFTPAAGPVVRDRVLFVGRITPSKGIDRLIQALPPELPLTVCGVPYHREYLGLLKQLARRKPVQFLYGASDEAIRSLYQRAWVTVLPSNYVDCYGNLCPAPELMGLTLLEAMACATPVLCARAGAMPEFVRPGETGFIYDNLAQLTDYLRYLAGNPAAVERMGRHARQAVAETYDLRVVGRKLLAVYQRLLASPKEAAA